MYHLIKKDLLIQKKSVILSVLLIIFFSLYFSEIGPGGLTLSVFAVTYMLTLGASAIGEKNDSDKMLISLPLKKSTIVLSKYLSVIVFVAYVIVLNSFIYFFVHFVKLPLNPIPITLVGILGSIVAPVFFCSISLPLIFKLGYLKSRMTNLILFFFIVFGGTALIEKIAKGNPDLANFLLNRSTTEIILIVLLPSLFIFIFSYFLSLFFYNNREF